MIQKYISKKNHPFWLITFSIAIGLILPKLIQDGMFLDGMLYTCVSHNLSKGIGTFWFPQFSPSFSPAGVNTFHEHPPLVFGIQSVFFKIFGDSMYVERFYTFLTMCFTAVLISRLWKNIYQKDESLKSISWLPVILWITIPACSWSYSNNMMENTMGIFTLGAIILIFRAIQSEQNEPCTLALSGVLIFLATFSKGVPGLFPLAAPFLYWLIIRKDSFYKVLIRTSIIAIVPVIIYIILFSLPQGRESLSFYLTKRFWFRINNDPTVEYRFYILKRLFTELLPQIFFISIVVFAAKTKKTEVPLFNNIRLSIFFISIGLAATVPMTLTLVQRGFYLVPSFPFFAVGLSILIAPIVLHFKENVIKTDRQHNIVLMSSILILVFTINYSIMQIGKIQRDRDMLHDVYTIGNSIPDNSFISVTPDLYSTYVLECYFVRYFNDSFNYNDKKKYLMTTKNSVLNLPDYEKLNMPTKLYDVYKLK